MILPPNDRGSELLAYPLERIVCPLCHGVRSTARCNRCNGAGVVFRSPRPSEIEQEEDDGVPPRP